jgi:hypothetical protein
MNKIFTSLKACWTKLSLLFPLGLGALLLSNSQPVWAQKNCMLVPVPLAERVAGATWVVEAQAESPRVVHDKRGHLLTRYDIRIFKVFRGPEGKTLPTSVLLAGGLLGNRRELVSSSPHLAAGQQGVFFLEPDPQHTGEWRFFAGPQGLISYQLATRTASEPFARYAAIDTKLYAALRGSTKSQGYRVVQTNAALVATTPGQYQTAALGAIGFSPANIAAGVGAVLTVTGSGFGATRGGGSVQFLNADNGGNSRVRPLDSDYISWTDTQIKVRVPAVTLEGSPAGTGPIKVVNGAGSEGISSTPLYVSYSIINLEDGDPALALRPRLFNTNGTGGYTLAYAPSFQLATAPNKAARAAFERANRLWSLRTGANRSTTTTEITEVPTSSSSTDDVNIVTFDTTPATLPVGVLGVTYSYYGICSSETESNLFLMETDFVIANRTDWNFGDHPLAANEYDFESVALHELGHGIQMGHVIDPTAVMNFSISNGQRKRTLGTADDQAGGANEIQFSSTPGTPDCGVAAHQALAVAAPLPVELLAFGARYAAGRGVQLSWTTASEYNSAYFAVETQEPGADAWTELRRQPAAGHSAQRRDYELNDGRLLSGTRYYRLRQVDTDGQAAYSPVAVVKGTEAGLSLVPNPAYNQLQVSGPASAGQLVFYDLSGRVVARFRLTAGPNQVDISNVAPGLYLVEWTDGQNVRRSRLEKL